MELNIVPFQSVGSLRFGASPEIIRSVFNSPLKSFTKGAISDMPTPTDAFDEDGVHVYYDKLNRCEAIEFYSPALLTFQGKLLVNQPYKEISEWLSSVDDNIVYDDSGLEARSLGIGLYAPNFDENERPDELVESVIVVSKGYWSD
jgi:hypothetical protein